jgi:transcriptional regulator of acetoin/glycerol metabolism
VVEASGNELPSTNDGSRPGEDDKVAAAPTPGALVVFCAGRPASHAFPLVDRELVLGRELLVGVGADDQRMSRRHLRIGYERGFHVEDLASRNGTFVDGRRVTERVQVAGSAVLRVGDSIVLLVEDVKPFLARPVEITGDVVVGATLRRVWDEIASAARAGDPLHLVGETGVGKELAAAYFHRRLGRKGELVAVNCAAVPASLAERLFFGARKGAYSGAGESDGYLQAAHGGTLFLDEVGELELEVQAKLLRVLETQEVTQLGGVRGKKVDFAICSATHESLNRQLEQGGFREDLYHRLCARVVVLPPLRERREDLPWLAVAALKDRGATEVTAGFIEELYQRRFSGNVRELYALVRAAAGSVEEGAALHASHLPAVEAAGASGPGERAAVGREEIVETLQRTGGNVSESARRLGLHRNQLRRLIKQLGIEVQPEPENG